MSPDCFVPRNDVKSKRYCEEQSNPEIKNITSYLFFVPKNSICQIELASNENEKIISYL
jgi:hypothetical protein